MKKILISIVTMVAIGLFMIQPMDTFAAEAVDVNRDCSLTLEYSQDIYKFSNENIKIYRIAEAFPDGSFQLVEPFKSYPIGIHGITQQDEWKKLATTLTGYISADKLTPYKQMQTDADGRVKFTGLETGLYMVEGFKTGTMAGVYTYESFLTYLPAFGDGNSLNYDVAAKPKCSYEPYPPKEEVEYKLLKLWNDVDNAENRPTSISVDIMKNGILVETVSLNAGNNWSHSWKCDDLSAVWTVAESSVPDGYEVSVAQGENSFTVTNTWTPPEEPEEPEKPEKPEKPDKPDDFHDVDDGDTPKGDKDLRDPDYYGADDDDVPGSAMYKTGDTTPIMFYVVAMCISGMVLVLLGVLGVRRTARR